MPIKADRWIRQMAQAHGMIEPFSNAQVAEGTISYGLSSYDTIFAWPMSSKSFPRRPARS